ncbi:hypothetical protein ACLQ24_30515, partial [Micromonospora sp. DT4]|uniref:hypothetical protein n=1 Tax=Micromonospora sp. DT4 TaxID=3393438 RepID=UPI003CF7508E
VSNDDISGCGPVLDHGLRKYMITDGPHPSYMDPQTSLDPSKTQLNSISTDYATALKADHCPPCAVGEIEKMHRQWTRGVRVQPTSTA